MERCIILLLLALSALCKAEDYPTCIVPDTTIINQLRERVTFLERDLSSNLSARIVAAEEKCQNNSVELENLETENRILRSTLEDMRETITTLIANQTAALNRERALQDPLWYTPFNGFQYRVTPSGQSWQRSREVCRSLGGDIAILGIQENNNRLRIAEALSLEQTWIGLSDLDQEGRWTWLDGTLAGINNVDWFPGEPSNSGRNQHCGEIWGGNFNYRLNDDYCNNRQQALCERRLI